PLTQLVNPAPNATPTLAAIGAQTVNEGSLLTFTVSATDPDSPPQTLTFTLDSGAPVGASITAAGVFTWTPTDAQGPGDYVITVRVTDSGSPLLSDAKSFSAHVRVVLSGTGCTPTIDGVLSPGEWTSAGTEAFNVNLPGGGSTQGTLYVMNDGVNLY